MSTGNYPTGGKGPPTAPGDAGGGGKSKWGWLVPVIGSVAGAILDKNSQDRANKANAQNVQAQIDFQREQNATQWQRAVNDIKAAGLNPALAYKQGGNNSGSGAAAENRAVMHGARLGQAVDAYNNLANGTAQRELTRQQAEATDAQRIKTLAEAKALGPEASLGESEDYRQQYYRTKLREAIARDFTAGKTEEKYMADLGATKQSTATAKQQESLMRTQATLNEQEFMNVWFRKNIAPYINSTAKTIEGIGGVGRTAKGLTGYKPTSRYY